MIFDMDGTLFDPTYRRKFVEKTPKDWESFFDPENVMKDEPIEAIVALAQRHGMTHQVHVVTARREADREVTTRQLRSAGVPVTKLHIVRPDGCHKPDSMLKKEWLEDSGLKDRIAFVVDDRSSVVRMWRDCGLVCLQCADGDF